MQNDQDLSKLRELIRVTDVAMLTTVDSNEKLISRPMALQELDDDGVLWFFTRDDAPKSKQLAKHHEVNIAFQDRGKNKYVSMSGTGVVSRDREKARELWNPALGIWFREGLQDPHLALLKVTVESAEIWDGPSNVITKIAGFAKGIFLGDKSLGSDHEKIAVNH